MNTTTSASQTTIPAPLIARSGRGSRWNAALRIDQVEKVYASGTRANVDISITVEPGEVFGLLGPNGAGKTTLVSQVMGLLQPTSGSIHLGEVDLIERPQAARQLTAYLPQGELPIESLRAREAVELIGRLHGGDATAVRARADQLFERLELGQWERQMGAQLSGGVQRLVGFMMAAVTPRPLVILDEPTNDVDPLRRRLLWQEIRALADRGSAVLLVTHNVLEAERAVDRLAIVNDGRVVAQGTPGALKSEDRGRLRIEVTVEPRADLPPFPSYLADPIRVGRRAFSTLLESDAARALDWVRDLTNDGTFEEFELGATSLEDTYVRLVGGGAEAEALFGEAAGG
jgi:ABC-2 type transport system ATP-binding protein